MERSKIVIGALVLVAAAAIVWVGLSQEGSVLPSPEQAAVAQTRDRGRAARANSDAPGPQREEPNAQGEQEETAETPSPDETEPNEPDAPADPNDGAAEPNAPDEKEEQEPEGPPEDPNDPFEAINLKDVEMKNIIEKIAEWTGKTVIPHEEAMKQKITIYAPQKLPRSKALAMIRSALRMKGFMVEEVDDTIFLKPLSEARLGVVPTVRADQPLAAFENRDQVVQKFFALENYPPAQMGEIIQPLVSEFGHVGVDETTNTVLVIDSVANLMRIERIIDQFDVPEAGKTITEIIPIQYGDPSEIVQLLRMLLGEEPARRGRSSYRGRPVSRPSPRPSSGGRGGSDSAATSVVISAGEIPIILIPEPKRKWIIASGSAEDIQKIHDWIEKLDIEEPVRSEYETVAITYADVREVASRIEDALQDMPGEELMPSVLVRPLEQSRQIMIFGRPELRQMVKSLIAEIDMPAGTFETRVFDLEHADPEQIKQNLDNLYGEDDTGSRYSYYYYRYRQQNTADTVKVTAFPTMGQVTVVASPENMRKIEQQIEEWDVPLDVDAVKPRIIELQNSDPVQMADLMTRLFTEESDSSNSLFRLLWYGDDMDNKKKIVGPLYGQLTFEDVPGTKKIIVISKIPQAYDVVTDLIYELDREEMAEIPHVVQLKYADPEDLSERLNAVFNEPGTTARIRRTARGLGDYSMESPSGNQSGGGNRDNDENASSPDEYTPWWSAGVRRTLDEEPISNVIGRARFIPDPRSKSILVLAPPQFHANIEKMIRNLDIPGRQVMIKATVLEVDHSAMTSLGVQLATNPEAFGTLEENAVTALGTLTALSTHGGANLSDNSLGINDEGTVGAVTTDIYALIDFLVKRTNAKILNQQTLWTEDNAEASFFKGQMVAFQTDISVSEVGGRVTSAFEFEQVGMTLAVRPSITPERDVDMIVLVNLSQLTGDFVNGQPVRTWMETETNMIVHDAETLMLGGILFQKNSHIKRKIPLLGDLPLVGGLFQHNDIALANNEMIVFITPYVITEDLSEEAKEEIQRSKRHLDEVKTELDGTSEELREELEEMR